VLVAGALSVASNWLRVYTIILAGHLTHMQSYLVRVSHYSYGWFVFMAALGAFFIYVRLRAPPPRAPAVEGRAEVRGVLAPSAWLAMTAAVAALPMGLDLLISAQLPGDENALLIANPPALAGGWSASAADSDWQPVQNGADVVRRWRFTRDGEVIETYAAGYIEQRQRKKLGGRANVPGGLDAEVLDESNVVAGDRGFLALELDRSGSRAVLWHGYQVGNRWFTSATRAQFWYAAHTLLTLRSPPSRVWMLHTRCESDCIVAGQRLGRFVELNGEALWPESP